MTTSIHPDINHPYYKLRWLQAAVELKGCALSIKYINHLPITRCYTDCKIYTTRLSSRLTNRDHTLNVKMCISRNDDWMSCGVDNAGVVAFVLSRHVDNTQRPGCRIHLVLPSYRLKHQSRYTCVHYDTGGVHSPRGPGGYRPVNYIFRKPSSSSR